MMNSPDKDNELLEIKDLRLIRLARSAHMLEQRSPGTRAPLEKGDGMRFFYLFDYFDSMTYVRNETLSAADCFGIGGKINQDTLHATSAQLIALVRDESFKNETGDLDPFEFDDEDNSRPFLSMLFVSLNTKLRGGPMYDDLDKFQRCSSENEDIPGGLEIVDGFLEDCRKEIEAAAEDIAGRIEKDKPICRLFQAVNYGDFCLVVRSALPEHAHWISVAIPKAHLRPERKDSKLHNVSYSTYTVSGLAYGNEDNDGLPFGRALVDEMIGHSSVTLRMRVDPRSLDKELEFFHETPSMFNTGRLGIFGWYDLSIGVSMRQFFLLYPLLRAIKLDGEEPDKALLDGVENIITDILRNKPLEEEQTENCKTCPLRERVHPDRCRSCTERLFKGLKENTIICLNERLAIGAKMEDPPVGFFGGATAEVLFGSQEDSPAEHDLETWDKKLIENRLKDIKSRIEKLMQKEHSFPYESELLRERMRQFDDLRKTFAFLWYQRESRLNGTYFMAQCEIALQGIESYVRCLEDGPPQLRQRIMKWLNKNIEGFINAANSFNKLTQSINFSSIQSPNYEIETRVDMEKYLVAYSEYLRSLSASFFSNQCRGCGHDRSFPLLYIDPSLPNILQDTLFSKMYGMDKRHGMDAFFDDDYHARLITVGIPSSTMLAKSYHVMPLLTHEISHFLRCQEMGERNELLLRFALENLTERLIKSWLSSSDSISGFGWIGRGIKGEIQKVLVDATIGYFESIKTDVFHYRDMPMKSFSEFLKEALLAMFNDDDKMPAEQTPETVAAHLSALLVTERTEQTNTIDTIRQAVTLSRIERPVLLRLLNELIGERRAVAQVSSMQRLLGTKSVQDLLSQLAKKNKIGYFEQERRFKGEMSTKNSGDKLQKKAFLIPPETFAADMEEHTKAAGKRIAAKFGLEEKNLPPDVRAALNVYIQDLWDINFHAYNAFIPKFDEQDAKVEGRENSAQVQLWLASESPAFGNAAMCVIASKAWEELKRRFLETLNDESKPLYTQMHARSGMKVINCFGILAQDNTVFLEGFIRSKAGISTKILGQIIDDSFQTYREICADIGMCKLLQLNQLGYLRVLARGLRDDELVERYDGTAAFGDRANVVLTLLDKGPPKEGEPDSDDPLDLKQLHDKAEEYIKNSLPYFAQKFIARRNVLLGTKYEPLLFDNLRSLLIKAAEQLIRAMRSDRPIRHGDFPKFAKDNNLTLDGLREEIGLQVEEMAMPAYNMLMLEMRDTYTIVYVLHHIRFWQPDKLVLYPHEGLLKAQLGMLKEVYDNDGRKCFRWDKNREGSYWMQDAGRYYNDSGRGDAFKDIHHYDRLLKSLRFVLYYYYRNRLLLSKSFEDKEFEDGNWGGDNKLHLKWLSQFTEVQGGDQDEE